MESAILSILISCLPNKSKKHLCKYHKNDIFISTLTSKPLLFNYPSFCKVLSINGLGRIVSNYSESFPPMCFNDRSYLVMKEILKMFMNQISTLKTLTYYNYSVPNNIPFTHFPGAKD